MKRTIQILTSSVGFCIMLGIGFPAALVWGQTNTPTPTPQPILVVVNVDKVGSTAGSNFFNLHIQAHDNVGSVLQSLSLSVNDENGTSFGSVSIPLSGGSSVTTLTSTDLVNLFSATSLAFQDGHTYDFIAQASDVASFQSLPQTDNLQVDNSPPHTGFFFTNNKTQSYPSDENWNAGTLQSTDLTAVPGAVVLQGPQNLLQQPNPQSTTTPSASFYDFNQPTGTVTPAPTPTPAATSLAVNAVALTNPSFDSGTLKVDSAVQFQPAPVSGGSNQISNAIDSYNLSFDFSLFFGTKDFPLFFSDANGSNGEIDFNKSNDDGANVLPSLSALPDAMFGFGGVEFELQCHSRDYSLTHTNYDFKKNLTHQIVIDRVDMNAEADTDAGGTKDGCAGGPTQTTFSMNIKLFTLDGKTIIPGGLQTSGNGSPGVNIFTGVPAQYFTAGQLMQPETITGIEVSGSGSQFTPCNAGDFLSSAAFNGPKIFLREVGAFQPALNLNPVPVASNLNTDFSPGGTEGGDPAKIFNYREDRFSYSVQSTTNAPSPAFAEVDQTYDFPVTISHIRLDGVNFSNPNPQAKLSFIFVPITTGLPVTVRISGSNPNISWQPIDVSDLGIGTNGSVVVTKFSLLMNGTPGCKFNFGKCALYGVPQPFFVGTGSPATFTSPIFDLGSNASADPRPFRLVWTGSTPNETGLRVLARTGTLTALQASPTAGYAFQPSGGIVPGLGQGQGNRYFQYQAVLSHNSPGQSPVLQSVVLQAGNYGSTGSWTSQPLGLASFNLPTGGTPVPPAVVSWRSKNPTGTSLNVSVQSFDGSSWSSPTPVSNGTPFPLVSGAQQLQFTANLQSGDGKASPELHALDFGFFSQFPKDSTTGHTFVVSATNIFFTPLDSSLNGSNSGVNQSFGIVSQSTPTINDFTLYSKPFQVNQPTGDYFVSAFSNDYAGNVEPTPASTPIHVSSLAIEGIANNAITNVAVAPSIKIDPGLSLVSVLVTKNPIAQPSATPSSFSLTCSAPPDATDTTQLPCMPTLTDNGSYVIIATASAPGAGNFQFPVQLNFTLWTTPPTQPTGIKLIKGSGSNGCGSGSDCLTWDPEPTSPVPPADPFFNGFTIVRDGATTLATNLTSASFTDSGAGTSDHVYQVYATDLAGNISLPAQISSAPNNLLISDTGNNRVFELGLTGGGSPGIIWQVGSIPTGTPVGTPVFINPISAVQVNPANGVNFGDTLVVDTRGAWIVNTTAFPPFVPMPSPTFTPVVTVPPSPTPIGSWTPLPTATPTPDPRLALLFSASSLGFSINQIQVSEDGKYILASQGPVTPGVTPVTPAGFVVKFDPSTQTTKWTIPALVNPTSERELGNGNILICDQGSNTVMEVNVSNPTLPSVVWQKNTSQGLGFNAPYDAIQGKQSGNYFIADTGNNRIVVLDKNHQDLTVIQGGLNAPRAVEERQTGNVVVADTGNNRIVEYAPSGSGNSTVFNPSGPAFTSVNSPFDVREVNPVNRIDLEPQDNEPIFVYHPTVLTVKVTDINGNPVANQSVNFSTNGLFASFVPSGTVVTGSVIDPNSGVPEGDVQFGGGPDHVTAKTDNSGTATAVYFPTSTGNNSVTVSSFETQTLSAVLYANQVEAIPPIPPPPPPQDFFSTVADVALGAISAVADGVLNSVGIPLTVNLSLEGCSVGIGLDFVSANIGTNGSFGVGFQADGATVGYNSQAGFNVGLQGGVVGLGWSQNGGFNGSLTYGGFQVSGGSSGFSLGVQGDKNGGPVAFKGASIGIGPDGSFNAGINMGAASIYENSRTGVGANINDNYLANQLGGAIDRGVGIDPNAPPVNIKVPILTDLGNDLTPLASGLTSALDNTAVSGINAVGDAATGIANGIGDVATGVADAVGSAANGIANAVGDAASGLANGVAQLAGVGTSQLPGACLSPHPVNIANGQLMYTSRDIFVPGVGPELNLDVTRVYNNLSDMTGSFGPRWTFTYDTYLLATPMTWEILFGDGHTELFIRNADGTATPYAYNRSSSLVFDPTSKQWTYKSKIGQQYVFNGAGRVVAQSDRFGNKLTYSYDPSTQLLSAVTDDAGRSLTFTFAGGGVGARITQVTDPMGQVYQYSYNGDGELTGVLLPSGRQITYAYAQNHLLAFRDDPRQKDGEKTFYYQYDKHNRVIQETNGLGYSTLFHCTMVGMNQNTVCTTTVTDARGNSTAYTFDDKQNWTKIVDPLGGVKTFTYDAFGNRLTATNALGNTTTYTYDANNNMASMTDPLNNTTSMTYEPVFSQLTSMTNALGDTWTYNYDGFGNMVQSIDPLGHTSSFAYNPHGRLVSSTNARGFKTTLTLDAYGNIVSSQDAIGNTYSYQFDILGRKTSATDALGNKTQYAFDPDNDLLQTTFGDGSTRKFIYNQRRNMVSSTDENNHATQMAYDAADELLSTTDACGGVEKFSYDPDGNMLTSTDKMGSVWTYTYNANNWITSVSNQDEGTITYAYDANGDKIAMVDGDGHAYTMKYDDNNHLVQITDPKGATTTMVRDALGRVSQSTDKNGNATKYFFDADGRTIKVQDALGNHVDYTYDEADNITSVSDQRGNATTTTYDANNRVLSVTRPEGDVKKYTYNAVGLWQTAQITGCSCGTRTYAYDNRNRVSSITDERGGISKFTYDNAGDQTQFTDANGHSIQTAYDACNRIIQATDPDGHVTQYARDPNGRATQTTDAAGGVWKFKYDQRGKVVQTTDANGGTSTFTYNHTGKLTSSTDANGHTTAFTYDEANNLVKVIDPLGNSTLHAYDPLGHIVQTTDANNHATNFKWDALSRLVETTNANGDSRETVYDGAGNATSVTDENGNTASFAYDRNNRLVQQTDPLGGVKTTTYDGRDLVTSVTDQDGNTTKFDYDETGNLVKTTNALGGTVSLTLDAVGNILSSTDPNGHTTTLQYDAANKLIAKTDALGNKTQFQYDSLLRLVKTTDALGFSTQAAYDHDSRLIRQTDPLGNVTQNTYDAVGNLTQAVDPNGNATSFTYDADNRRTQAIDALGGRVATVYDPVGNKTQVVDQNGNATKMAYDPVNRPIQVTDALGGITASEYDAVGNVTAVTDANGNTTHFTYDANNRKTSVKDARGGVGHFKYDAVGNTIEQDDANGNSNKNQFDQLYRLVAATNGNGDTTQFEYDAVGNRTAVIDANSHTTAYAFDADNRQLSETDPVGNQTKFGYDAVGNVVTKTDSKGTRNLKYDADRRLLEEDLPDGKKETSTYDPGGRTIQTTDWNGTYQFEYDNDNRLLKRIVPDGKFITHKYDAVGNEVGRTDYFGGNYTYIYDALNRPVQTIDTLGGVTGILYDHTSHVVQYHHPNNTSVNYTYDPIYDTLTTVNKKDSGEVISQFAYDYDAVGNRLDVTDNVGKTSYTYDNANWLTDVQYPDRPAVTYTFDSVGNRLSMTVGSQVTHYTYNAANMVQQAGDETFTFDGNGNMVKRINGKTNQTTTYAYDTENRLVQASLPDGTQTQFGYDHTNMRILATEPDSQGKAVTKQFLWSGNDVVNEDTPESQTAYNVLRNVNLSKTITEKCCDNPQAMYYHFDALGSIANTTDAGANLMNDYRYDSFGETLGGGQGGGNDLQFVGGLGVKSQANIGLSYMRNRWYDDTLGRFITKDPMGYRGGINIYIYVANNPINGLDPMGLCDDSKMGVKPSIDLGFGGVNLNLGLFKVTYGGQPLWDPSAQFSLTPALVGADFNLHLDTGPTLIPEGYSVYSSLEGIVPFGKYLAVGSDSSGANISLGAGIGSPIGVSKDINSSPSSPSINIDGLPSRPSGQQAYSSEEQAILYNHYVSTGAGGVPVYTPPSGAPVTFVLSNGTYQLPAMTPTH